MIDVHDAGREDTWFLAVQVEQTDQARGDERQVHNADETLNAMPRTRRDVEVVVETPSCKLDRQRFAAVRSIGCPLFFWTAHKTMTQSGSGRVKHSGAKEKMTPARRVLASCGVGSGRHDEGIGLL